MSMRRIKLILSLTAFQYFYQIKMIESATNQQTADRSGNARHHRRTCVACRADDQRNPIHLRFKTGNHRGAKAVADQPAGRDGNQCQYGKLAQQNRRYSPRVNPITRSVASSRLRSSSEMRAVL